MSFKIRTLVAVATLTAAMTGGWVWSQARKTSEEPSSPPPVPVGIATVQKRNVAATIRAVGTVRSQRNVDIRSQVDGQLVELLVSEGQQVRRGDLLARIDDRALAASLQQVRGELAATRAQLAAATTDLTRYRTLAKEQTISAQMFDQQSALVSELRATIHAREAAVATGEVLLSYTRIRSPVNGRVGFRNVDEGNYVRSSDAQALFSVVQVAPISVEFSLPQERLPQIQTLLTDAAHVPVQAYSGDGGTLLAEGRLGLIDNRVSEQTGSIRLKAEFANIDGRLWPDQSVAVTLQSDTLLDALVVPQRAILQGADSARLWRVRAGKAESLPVQIEYSDEQIAVVRGIAAGDVVVTDGQSRLRPGSDVLTSAPDATPKPDATTDATRATNRSRS